MPKYVARATVYSYLDVYVEAEDEEEALEFAEEADGGDFIERTSDSDWEILDDEVEKLS